jgi:hypothetical protein
MTKHGINRLMGSNPQPRSLYIDHAKKLTTKGTQDEEKREQTQKVITEAGRVH